MATPPPLNNTNTDLEKQTFAQMQQVWNYKKVHSLGNPILPIGVVLAFLIGIAAATRNLHLIIIVGIVIALLTILFIVLRERLFKPSPTVLIINGMLFIFLGLFTIASEIISSWVESEHSTIFLAGGFIIIAMGFQNIAKSKRLSKLPDKKPSEEETAEIDQIIKDLQKAKAKDNENVIEFDINTTVHYERWKGLLEPHGATFISPGGNDAIFAHKSEILIQKKRGFLERKNLQAEFQFGEHNFRGKINDANFAKYEKWEAPAPS